MSAEFCKSMLPFLQICILDEPSNFLDREALGGLAVAIRDWAGAVVSFTVISSVASDCRTVLPGHHLTQHRIRLRSMFVMILLFVSISDH